MFVLDKWYLDLVTADGAAFVGYSACLHWLGFRIAYQSSLYSPADGPVEERTSLHHSPPPVCLDGEVEWRSPAIEAGGTWRRTAPGLRRRLIRGEGGTILWLCLQPRALGRVSLPGGRTLTGDGYVERLRMTLPPSRLPFDTLHWGRFHGESETLVWIAWQRGAAGRWIFRNGAEQRDAVVSDQGVSLDDGAWLRFSGLRPLRERRVLPALAAIPGLRHGTAGTIARMHERKWTGQGVLHRPAGADAHGWLIHEEVSWRADRA